MRRTERLVVQPSAPLPALPPARTHQFVVRVPGRSAPLEAMVVRPAADTERVLVYFLGFNDPLGPWEGAKAALLAEAFGAAVVAVELPGQSRFGDPIPGDVRGPMLRGRIEPWVALQWDYLRVAMEVAGLSPTGFDVLGYSTGCSLAMSSLGTLAGIAPLRSVMLIEPVGALRRSMGALAVHNLLDVVRQPPSYRSNHAHDWVMELRNRQLREPWIRYWPQDLMAITTILRRDHIRSHLALLGDVPLHLVRGSTSDLCRADAFRELGHAHERGVSITVPGFGHPLWHAFPVLVPLIRRLRDANG